MQSRRVALFLSAVALSTFLCGAIVEPSVRAGAVAPQAAPDVSAAADAQRGEKVFASNCAMCHGPTAKGSTMGVSLIDSTLVRHDKAASLIGPVVKEGRADKGMPAFPRLTPAQLADIAAFLHARIATTDSVETAGPKGGYQLQHLLTGSADAGKRYFNGAGGCSRCHQPTGDLAGIAKKYRPAELEARFLHPSGGASSAEVTLPSGNTVKGTLQYRDTFNVALIDAEGHYRSWPLTSVKVKVDDPVEAHVRLLDLYTNKEVHDLFAYLETLQ